MKINTKLIHGGQQYDPSTGAVNVPVYLTSTYAQSAPGEHQGYEYSRAANPTRTALENSLASIEGGARGLAFSSGLAAIDAVMKLLSPGDEVIVTDDLYGGSYRMFTRIYSRYQIQFHFVDMGNPDDILPLINSKTKMIWVETPGNPLMKIIDIQKVAEISNAHSLLCVVDNTFASPYLQQPLSLGADIVMHSATKYLGGHSDLIAGALIAKDDKIGEELHFQQFASGGILGPHDSYLVLRGIKTLGVRMDRHCDNADEIFQYLKNHPKIGTIYFPGNPSNQSYNVTKSQMKRAGGMIAFDFASKNADHAISFLKKLQVFCLAESLGGVESLANHPTSMTHASIPKDVREAAGIHADLVRLSIGIEDVEDLIQDLDQALS